MIAVAPTLGGDCQQAVCAGPIIGQAGPIIGQAPSPPHDQSSLEEAEALAIFGESSDDEQETARGSQAGTRLPATTQASCPPSFPAQQAEAAAALTSTPAAEAPPARACAPPAAAAAAAAPPPPARRRTVLVAKCLTNSDAGSGRVILPRLAVESNLPFVVGYRHYSLSARDARGRPHALTIKSWANGTEHRRVYVLEGAIDFLRSHGVGVGDAVGICSDERGQLVIEANSDEVRQATVSPKYLGATALVPPPGPPAAAVPLVLGASARCLRSPHCTKNIGHPGFCSGPRVAAAATAAARQQQRGVAMAPATAAKQQRGGTATVPAASTCGSGGPGSVATTSSGGEAATQLATSSGGGAVTSAPSRAALPPGLHPVAYIPAGLALSKELTGYDISSGRVVMPAPDVEAGLPSVLAPGAEADAPPELLTLAAVDESQGWQFPTLRAWTNVAGRRGYLLEGAGPFLAVRGAAAGDRITFFRHTDLTPPRVELRASGTDAPCLPTAPPAADTPASIPYCQLPLLLHPPGSAAARAAPRGAQCRRTPTCTKGFRHQGFCSGHKGYKRRESPTAAASGSSSGSRRQAFSAACTTFLGYASPSDDDDKEYTPSYKRPRRTVTPRGAASGTPYSATAGSVSAASTPRACDPLLSLLACMDPSFEADPPADTAPGACVTKAVAAAEAAAAAEAEAAAAYARQMA
eukprot:scaffold18.g1968.t1